MDLLPGWKELLEATPKGIPTESLCHFLPKSTKFYAEELTYVTTATGVQDLVELAQQRALSHIGFDTEFRYDRHGVRVKSDRFVFDPRSIHPLLLSLALVEKVSDSESQVYLFVVDLRNEDIFAELKKLFHVPVCFVGHFLKVELLCLWQMGIPEPRLLWDTWVHEKAQSLGLNHKRYRLAPSADVADEARAQEDVEAVDQFSLALVSTCHRYGIPYEMEGEKTRLQASFLTHPDDASFSEDQLCYSAEDALAAARLYFPQTVAATQTGILHHLVTVEMLWTITSARMEWHGVRVNSTAREQVLASCAQHRPHLVQQLLDYGVDNARSHKQLHQFFEKEGLLHLFKHKGGYSFEKNQLKLFLDHHPAISIIRAIRRMDDLRSNPILKPELVGCDGRVHPEYRQLGTHTGRQTSQNPNILGLDRALRPVIIPDPGYGIGEVDWSQIEVGVAAAVYHDQNLVEMFNSGDVYAAMAQQFFHEQLTQEDYALPSKDFKQKCPALRSQMKTCTLGVIYGMTAKGMALALNTTVKQTAAFQERFVNMFPGLKTGLAEAVDCGGCRGYARTHTGLRRYRPDTGLPSSWERNWLKNHPVQGSAATLFKMAGNRLDRLYQPYGGRLIIPLHDAFIFEAPLGVLEDVANLTARVMRDTVQEQFPELHPRVEINTSHPECWNKDGDAEAFSRWLRNPLE